MSSQWASRRPGNMIAFRNPMSILLAPLISLLFFENVQCKRNVFLPPTGEIHIGSTATVIAENLSNVTNFESLLGAGRSLAYPFAAGMLLSIATLANGDNWKVSDTGFDRVLGIPREEIIESYGALLKLLETDENVTTSNVLFSFRPNYSPSEILLDALMTEVREVTWTRETWKETYRSMVEHLSNVTNEKIDTLLIPSVTKIGTPFRKSTEAVLLNTFHYINGWQYPWSDSEVGTFQGNDGIPFLKVEGNFFVAEEQEFTSVAVPLEGGTKSVVFVLPHENVTSKYLRKPSEDEEQDEVDIVPFPKNWKLRNARLRVPAFNTTDVDQYGSELEQVGMNETFCTIIQDSNGRFPHYLRPMVQVNFLDFNEDFLELASATGVAVEKFHALFHLIVAGSVGGGHGANLTDPFDSDSRAETRGSTEPHADGTINADNPTFATYISLEDGMLPAGDVLTLSFDRGFLWYLNDTEAGPMFFGTVETLINPAFGENSTEPGGDDNEGATTMLPPSSSGINAGGSNATNMRDDRLLSEIDKYFLWSCRSYVPSAMPAHGVAEVPDSLITGFEPFEDEPVLTSIEAYIPGSNFIGTVGAPEI